MKKFYIASSFNNKNTVRYVSQHLKEKGFIHTYDWTENQRASTSEDLKAIGEQEKYAVLESDFIIVLLPAGKGSHIELGIALGQGIKIYLYSPNEEINNFDTTSTFYHVSGVEHCFGNIKSLIDKITKSEYVSKIESKGRV